MLTPLILGVVLVNRSLDASASVGAKVDAVVAREMKAGHAVGISVAVAKNGKIVYERGYGIASLENSVKASAQTIYHTCSIGKHMTAAGVLKLVEQGKLALSDDVGKYVPALAGRGITIDEMLSHTSGLGDFSVLPDFVAKERQDWTHDDLVKVIANEPMHFSPGTSWSYSNSAFYLLGIVIEKVSGVPYYQFMQKNVWGPAGMHVYDGGSDAVIPHFTYGYSFVHGKAVKANPMSWQPVFSAGNMCCKASDLVRYEMALEAGKIIPHAMVDLMRAPHKLSNGLVFDYGYGTRRGSLEGHEGFGHTGGGGGYTTVLISFPTDHLVVAVMQNNEGGIFSPELGTEIARPLLGLSEDKRKDLPIGPDIAKLKFGVYHTSDADYEVFLKDGKMHIRPKGSKGVGFIDPYQGRCVFSFKPNRREVLVVQGDEVPYINLYAGPLLIDVARRID